MPSIIESLFLMAFVVIILGCVYFVIGDLTKSMKGY